MGWSLWGNIYFVNFNHVILHQLLFDLPNFYVAFVLFGLTDRVLTTNVSFPSKQSGSVQFIMLLSGYFCISTGPTKVVKREPFRTVLFFVTPLFSHADLILKNGVKSG